ncbi:hypothetical protein LCGC14_1184110 [marine sediment metagenome]|uniref:Uncharacterized protein n=1 Tax=marine sediment metagenome TaxID=412755 RepID=A0A0F9M933_9ZZZZ|nr:hypothetical protein [Candidatus Aminicenantes bacterium]
MTTAERARIKREHEEERINLWYVDGMQDRVRKAFPGLPHNLQLLKYIEKLEKELFGETL